MGKVPQNTPAATATLKGKKMMNNTATKMTIETTATTQWQITWQFSHQGKTWEITEGIEDANVSVRLQGERWFENVDLTQREVLEFVSQFEFLNDAGEVHEFTGELDHQAKKARAIKRAMGDVLVLPLDIMKDGQPTTSHILSFQYTVLRGTPLHHRFGLGHVMAGDAGNCDGDGFGQNVMKAGPWAYAFGLCVAICSNPAMNSGAESDRNKAAGTEHVIEDGQLVSIANITYRCRIYRRDFLALDPVNA
jgi:hypothetical protein